MGNRAQNEEGKGRLETAYDRFARDVQDLLADGRDLGRQSFAAAREASRTRLAAAGQRLHPERLRDGSLATLAKLLRSGGETLQEWSHKADEAVIYESGEITRAGTLTCLNCGHAIHLDHTAEVAPCPACMSTRFRKSF